MADFEFIKDCNLKNFCTFHIGGKAKFLFIVYSNSALIRVCNICKTHNIKYKIIGLGANLLFDDLGFNGAIIINKSKEILIENNYVWADAGVNLTSLILVLKQKHFGNFEKLCSIPSTIGGGVVNNVGAFGVELGEFVEMVEVRHKSDLNTPVFLTNLDCKFSYRNSIFKYVDYIITRVKLTIQQKDEREIEQNIAESLHKKSTTQPLECFSAGSVFKRGSIIPAKVIDELGLKGLSRGGAQISNKHAGFIINTGKARSQDVKDLIDLIKRIVLSNFGEKLETEIEFVEP